MRRGMCSCWPLSSQAETCFPLSRIHFGLDAVYKKCSLANLVRNRNVRDAEWMGSSGLTKFSDSYHFLQVFQNTYFTLHRGYELGCLLGIWRSRGLSVKGCNGRFAPGDIWHQETLLTVARARRWLSLQAKVAAEHFPFQRRSITSPGPYNWILGASQLYFIPV